jgi:hypothetical protein
MYRIKTAPLSRGRGLKRSSKGSYLREMKRIKSASLSRAWRLAISVKDKNNSPFKGSGVKGSFKGLRLSLG